MQTPDFPIQLGRRAFLKNGVLTISVGSATNLQRLFAAETAALTIGLVTDLHYADRDPRGTRYYRETLRKLAEAGEKFQAAKPDFLVELGDLIDAAETVALEQQYLKTINDQFSEISPRRHYVLGNHCVETLTKQEFLGGVQQEKSYFSFDQNNWHFVVLDACFRHDGQPYGRHNSDWKDANIPPEEVEWLKADLKANDRPTIVFAHQRLDVANVHGVKNNAEIRQVLEDSNCVKAVFQGHSHRNDLKEINGIHYCTLVAMIEGTGVENNGYSLLKLHEDGSLQLEGFRHQENYRWHA